MPRPRVMWGQLARPISSRSRFSNACGSRLAAPTDVVPSAQREPVHLAVREHAPERRLHRRVEPQQLLDRRRRAGTFLRRR